MCFYWFRFLLGEVTSPNSYSQGLLGNLAFGTTNYVKEAKSIPEQGVYLG